MIEVVFVKLTFSLWGVNTPYIEGYGSLGQSLRLIMMRFEGLVNKVAPA